MSLNKFVRLAGDLLPPPLFVPYMEMLSGLANSPQAAHHCFNLLKSTANGPLSWDHFFASIKQYYMDLRQDGARTGKIGKCFRVPLTSQIFFLLKNLLVSLISSAKKLSRLIESLRFYRRLNTISMLMTAQSGIWVGLLVTSLQQGSKNI